MHDLICTLNDGKPLNDDTRRLLKTLIKKKNFNPVNSSSELASGDDYVSLK